MRISEQRPQGPVSPICQKFSDAPSSVIRDGGTSVIQILNASSSRAMPPSPLNTVGR
jgi:hypothetical protein